MAGPLFFERVMQERPFEREVAEAILEVAYLTMSADHHIDVAERRTFAAIAAKLLDRPSDMPLAAGDVDRWIDSLARKSEATPREERVESLAATLSHDARKAAYQVACLMALADQDESDREFEFDLTLIAELDLAQDDADALAAEARRSAAHP